MGDNEDPCFSLHLFSARLNGVFFLLVVKGFHDEFSYVCYEPIILSTSVHPYCVGKRVNNELKVGLTQNHENSSYDIDSGVVFQLFCFSFIEVSLWEASC